MEVKFYDSIDDSLLKFAVIISQYKGKLVFCKHKQRNTLEIPGGHREKGEKIEETARRELYEETGAVDFTIEPVCVYSVVSDDNFSGEETFGMLFCAEITALEDELHSEIEKIYFLDELPTEWTYPLIQPKLIDEAIKRGLL